MIIHAKSLPTSKGIWLCTFSLFPLQLLHDGANQQTLYQQTSDRRGNYAISGISVLRELKKLLCLYFSYFSERWYYAFSHGMKVNTFYLHLYTMNIYLDKHCNLINKLQISVTDHMTHTQGKISYITLWKITIIHSSIVIYAKDKNYETAFRLCTWSMCKIIKDFVCNLQ